MRLVILGATGTTGGYAVDEALAAGHEVVAFVRKPGALAARARLTIVGGSVEDEAAMRTAFAGADAVLSCLGARPSFEVLLGGTDFQRRMLPKVVSAINEEGIGRFVLMSSFGIGETRYKASLFPRLVLYTLVAKRLFDDKVIAERSLAGCKANWTGVYPVTLRGGPVDPAWDLLPLDDVRSVPGLPTLSFATVAKVLVDLVPNRSHAGQKLLLTTSGGWR
jgi:uncharacterized protein YbjT (DUF2867 family)